ncbi:hypothetical protein CAPTEDRAFT_111681, partial [Capitella teleta]
KLIKSMSISISEPLALIFNQCIENAVFPDKWKIALFKIGDETDPNNYQPISLLPSISKVFERFILKLNQLQSFFDSNNLLFKSQ